MLVGCFLKCYYFLCVFLTNFFSISCKSPIYFVILIKVSTIFSVFFSFYSCFVFAFFLIDPLLFVGRKRKFLLFYFLFVGEMKYNNELLALIRSEKKLKLWMKNFVGKLHHCIVYVIISSKVLFTFLFSLFVHLRVDLVCGCNMHALVY